METALKQWPLVPVLMILLCSCTQTGSRLVSGPKEKSEIAGTYRIILAKSDVPVDLNFDNLRNTNMIRENPEIKFSELLIGETDEGGFDLVWMDQRIHNLNGDTTISYTPTHIKSKFQYDSYNHLVTLLDSNFPVNTYKTGMPPVMIHAMGDGVVKLNLKRKLYTREGLKDLNIEAVYKKADDKLN